MGWKLRFAISLDAASFITNSVTIVPSWWACLLCQTGMSLTRTTNEVSSSVTPLLKFSICLGVIRLLDIRTRWLPAWVAPCCLRAPWPIVKLKSRAERLGAAWMVSRAGSLLSYRPLNRSCTVVLVGIPMGASNKGSITYIMLVTWSVVVLYMNIPVNTDNGTLCSSRITIVFSSLTSTVIRYGMSQSYLRGIRCSCTCVSCDSSSSKNTWSSFPICFLTPVCLSEL